MTQTNFSKVPQTSVAYFNQVFTDWLYGGWSKQKLEAYEVLNAIPGVHQYMDYKLDVRRDNEYLNRYGMSYEDIHDPRKLSQVGSATRGLEWVSQNIGSLYKNDRAEKRRESYYHDKFMRKYGRYMI